MALVFLEHEAESLAPSAYHDRKASGSSFVFSLSIFILHAIAVTED